MKIQMRLKDVIGEGLYNQGGLDINPYAISEGADPESLIEVEVKSVEVF